MDGEKFLRLFFFTPDFFSEKSSQKKGFPSTKNVFVNRYHAIHHLYFIPEKYSIKNISPNVFYKKYISTIYFIKNTFLKK